MFVHLVWSTWDRAPILDAATRDWLWPMLANTARERGCPWAVVGGIEDHVHVLCALPTTLAVAQLVRDLKGVSARAANQRRPESFRWQGGYGAFSVSPDAVADVRAYVVQQAEHHRTGTTDDLCESAVQETSAQADGAIIASQFSGRAPQ
jgi:REP element-mobilizing transposase RayT